MGLFGDIINAIGSSINDRNEEIKNKAKHMECYSEKRLLGILKTQTRIKGSKAIADIEFLAARKALMDYYGYDDDDINEKFKQYLIEVSR